MIQNMFMKKVQKFVQTNYTICRFIWSLQLTATDMVPGRHLELQNGRR